MRKLSSEEATEPITFRAKKTVIAEFRQKAAEVELGHLPGKFFEQVWKKYKEATQQPGTGIPAAKVRRRFPPPGQEPRSGEGKS